MSRIKVVVGDCSMADVEKLMDIIRKNKHVIGLWHTQDIGPSWSSDTKDDFCPHCKHPLDGIGYRCMRCMKYPVKTGEADGVVKTEVKGDELCQDG